MNGDGRSAQGNNFLMQVLYLPVTLFMSSIDMLGKMLGGVQRATAGATGRGQTFNASATITPPPPATGQTVPASFSTTNATFKETTSMANDNQDLSGDDIKRVVYSILFNKRDLETTLKTDTEDLVAYDTDGGSYGAIKIAEFAGEDFARPDSWQQDGYPSINSGPTLTLADIPKEDRKYIRFSYEVRARIPKGSREYEREQTQALRGIRNVLEERL